VTDIAFAGLVVAGLLVLWRLIRGGSLSDRVVALDSLLIVVVCGIAVHAARTGDGTYVDVAVVTALLGFVGTTTVARFIERQGT
jgi:multicomponent Na+:H+ antiporter subunit F